MKTLYFTAFMMGACVGLPAHAGPIHAWIFVDPDIGNDGTCNTQLSKDGSITPPPYAPGTVPCKTFTKACALLPTDAGNWVIQGSRPIGNNVIPHYIENVVCRASGRDPANRLTIVAGDATHTPAYLKGNPNSSAPAWEMTGSHVYLNKFIFDGSPSDVLYVHGTDDFHQATDDVIGYNTYFQHNGGYAVHADYTYWFLMYNDTILENAGNVGARGCILIEDSWLWLIQSTSIYRCGSSIGIPSTPKPGVIAHKTIYGTLVDSKVQEYAFPNLLLEDSFNALVVVNATKPPQAPFSYQVTSAVSATEAANEAATDIFSDN